MVQTGVPDALRILFAPSGIREYRRALEQLVDTAVDSSSGISGKFRIRKGSGKKNLSYVAFEPSKFEKEFEIDCDAKNAERRIERARKKFAVVPYIYVGYDGGKEGAAVDITFEPLDDLLVALHEKRHSGKHSGGLNRTRLGDAYYRIPGERAKRHKAENIGEGGLIQEAACDFLAYYDLRVLGILSGDSAAQRGIDRLIGRDDRHAKRIRAIIERRRSALQGEEKDWKAARAALFEYGKAVSKNNGSPEEVRLYSEALRGIRADRDVSKTLAKLKERVFPEHELGNYGFEDLLAVKMLYRSEYTNERVETRVEKLGKEFSPDQKEVAAGRAKNPFSDVIGLHRTVGEIEETLGYLERARANSESWLRREARESFSPLFDGKCGSEERYSSLRKLYALAKVSSERGLDFGALTKEYDLTRACKDVAFETCRLFAHSDPKVKQSP